MVEWPISVCLKFFFKILYPTFIKTFFPNLEPFFAITSITPAHAALSIASLSLSTSFCRIFSSICFDYSLSFSPSINPSCSSLETMSPLLCVNVGVIIISSLMNSFNLSISNLSKGSYSNLTSVYPYLTTHRNTWRSSGSTLRKRNRSFIGTLLKTHLKDLILGKSPTQTPFYVSYLNLRVVEIACWVSNPHPT